MLQKLLLTLVTLATTGCYAGQSSANHFIVFDDVPTGLPLKDNNQLIIRTNFPGSVEFIDSPRFHIDVNVTSPDVDALSQVHYNYTLQDGSIFLQLFEVEKAPLPLPWQLFTLGILIVTSLALLISTLIMCWWHHVKRPLQEKRQINITDASQAPLLDPDYDTRDAKQTPSLRSVSRQSRDEYASSEDERDFPREDVTSPRFGHPPNVRVSSLRREPPTAREESGHMSDSAHETSMEEPFPPPPPPEKPVVSYIRPEGSILRDTEGIYSDADGQTTLKVRFDDQPSEQMPDVIREQPVYSTVNKNRGMCSRQHTQEEDFPEPPYPQYQAQEDELQRIYSQSGDRLYNSQSEGRENMYVDKPVPLSNMASILRERPRTGINPSTRLSPKEHNMEQVELDSVGSSRSGESSRSSGMRTQSSYTDSNYGSDRRAPIYTDSDSAYSGGSSATRSRDSGVHGIRVYARHGPTGHNDDDIDSFPSPSASDPSSTGSCPSPRMVDEAYGTLASRASMASTGSTSLRSTTSTGSGSSGSVVTVINNDDVTGGRKRVYFKPGVEANNGRRNGGGAGGGRGMPHHYLQTSIICVLSVLCLSTGVYCMTSRTTVSIKIYAPRKFLHITPEVFTNTQFDVFVSQTYRTQALQIAHYKVENTHLEDIDSSLCDSNACEHGCDARTGQCVCMQGYRLATSREDETKCIDFNECDAGLGGCHDEANCINFNGYHRCDCRTGHYGNGINCTSCNTPCTEGTFEAQPCISKTRQVKICQECTPRCPEGQYISSQCNSGHDIKCSACSDACEMGMYEFTPCHGSTDRICKPILSLPAMSSSRNVISENRLKVKNVVSHYLHQEPNMDPLTYQFTLNRGTGISVNVRLQGSSLAPQFRAVQHRDSHDSEYFRGDPAITDNYCLYPVPEKYSLSLKMHKGITSRAKFYNCAERQKKGEKCSTETGYYLDYTEPCKTYATYGRLPELDSQGSSVVCTRPGTLSELFHVSRELDDMKTMYYVDEKESCSQDRTKCGECAKECASRMQRHSGMNKCNITAEESDNGESPRLQYCYGCCAKQQCTERCEVYHNPSCKRQRCITGDIAEFVLTPIWSHSGTVYGCHIEPQPNYTIYDLEITVNLVEDGRIVSKTPINNRRLKVKKTFDGKHPKNTVDEQYFLKVGHGSDVSEMPTFLQGDTGRNQYSVGYYYARGVDLDNHYVDTTPIYIRPKKPFEISTKLWKKSACDTDLLEDLVIVDTRSPSSGPSDPYSPIQELTVIHLDKFRYQVFNRDNERRPFIYFEIPRDQSVLASLYDVTSVKDDSTLHMEILRDHSLKVKGQLTTCPGFFSLQVKEASEKGDILFHYDVGVSCPTDFSLIFRIPARSGDSTEKRLIVQIQDSYRTITGTVVRPVSQMTEETRDFFWKNETYNSPVNYENKGEIQMNVFTPLVTTLGIVIACLLLLLIVGFITETRKRPVTPDSTAEKVETRHLLFVVCHVTFNTAYSVAITFTVLALLIYYVNREPVQTLTEFSRYLETSENLQQAEMQRLQTFVLQELQRQNTEANSTKLACEQNLVTLQDSLEEMKQTMVVGRENEELISEVALEYTRRMLQNLTDDVNKFKKDFTTYARMSIEKLQRNIAGTSTMLKSNKWLAGAKDIHDTVASKRSNKGLSTKPLLEWMGLKDQIDIMHEELSLDDFPLPDIQEFLKMDLPQLKTATSPLPKLEDITLPRNQWYFHKNNVKTEDSISRSNQFDSTQDDGNTYKNAVPWKAILIFLIVIDCIWFIHRMANTYATSRMLLYGAPVFVHYKNTESQRGPDSSCFMKMLEFIKDLNLRVMKTDFIPKLVAAVTTACVLYFSLGVSNKLLTVKAMASVGYIESMVAPVETSYQLARTRLKTNAYRINKFEYPFYEELVNVRTKRYQLLLNMYAQMQQTSHVLHDSELCSWKKLLDPDMKCNCTTVHAPKLHFPGCELPPVLPRPYDKKDFGAYRDKQATGLVPFLNAARYITLHTCYLVLLFVLMLILVDTLGSVLWIYFKRFGWLRIKQLVEVEHLPSPQTQRGS